MQKALRNNVYNLRVADDKVYFEADDDGIINVDTINLMPGTVIPKAPGSGGLQPIRAAGDFNVANLILNDTEIETLSQEALRDEISPDKVREQMYEILENPEYEAPNENPDTIVKQKLMLEIQRRIKDAEDGWLNWLESEIDAIDPI